MLNEHYDVTTAAYAVGYESYPISVGNIRGLAFRSVTPTEVIHRLAPVVTVLLIIVELTVIRMSVTVGMVTAARFITE